MAFTLVALVDVSSKVAVSFALRRALWQEPQASLRSAVLDVSV
jgi:hypothetical protein